MEQLPPSLVHVFFEHYIRFTAVLGELRSYRDPKTILTPSQTAHVEQ